MSARLLTFSEATDLLRVSDKTLRAIIKGGGLRAAKVGSTWRIRDNDLESYLEAAWRFTKEDQSITTSSSRTGPATGDRRASGRSAKQRNGSATTAPASWAKHLPRSKRSEP